MKKYLHKAIDYLWLRFWWHIVPKRIKENYKYVGYEIWYLDGMIKVLEEEHPEDNMSPWNRFQRGRLHSYKEILGKLLKEE